MFLFKGGIMPRVCASGDGNEAARVFLAHRGDEEDVAVSVNDKACLLVVLRVLVDPTSLHWWRCGVSFMLGTPSRSRQSSPESPQRVETPVHRFSRRLLGLAPELNPLPESSSSRLPSSTTMATAAAPSDTAESYDS